MLYEKCIKCGEEKPMNEFIKVQKGNHCDIGNYCKECSSIVLKDLSKEKLEELGVEELIDPTVCSVCSFDNKTIPLKEKIANIPACEKCITTLRNRPFPLWVTISTFLLIAFGIITAIRGIGFFKAELKLLQAQKLIEETHYTKASKILNEVLKIAPNSKTVILSKVEADLKSGNIVDAYSLLNKHKDMKITEDENAKLKTLIKEAEEKILEKGR